MFWEAALLHAPEHLDLSLREHGVSGQGHGNSDTVHNAVVWDPTITSHILPASLYLVGKPAWWPTGTPWPWAGPDVTPMVGPLPAKQRSDAMGL